MQFNGDMILMSISYILVVKITSSLTSNSLTGFCIFIHAFLFILQIFLGFGYKFIHLHCVQAQVS